jgi:hypothetical protein
MTNYSKLERLLHKIALGSPSLSELTFDLEKRVNRTGFQRTDSVYVTGLARAGTTTVMRALYASAQFASLTYNDMPFVLAPNLWSKVSGFKGKLRQSQERAHKDGIQVNYDSPESFEEVFWRLHCEGDYIFPASLAVHDVDQNTLNELNTYHNLICLRNGKKRYLAKNNNTILRLNSLANNFKDCTFLVVFRHPFSQAKSLLQQHIHFKNNDKFTHQYMNWLVHHEFGSTHRPFDFSTVSIARTDHIERSISTDSSRLLNQSKNECNVDYWLQRWVDAYGYLLTVLERGMPNVIPVSYEKICNQPEYWQEICQQVRLDMVPYEFNQPQLTHYPSNDYYLKIKSLEIYESLYQATN